MVCMHSCKVMCVLGDSPWSCANTSRDSSFSLCAISSYGPQCSPAPWAMNTRALRGGGGGGEKHQSSIHERRPPPGRPNLSHTDTNKVIAFFIDSGSGKSWRFLNMGCEMEELMRWGDKEEKKYKQSNEHQKNVRPGKLWDFPREFDFVCVCVWEREAEIKWQDRRKKMRMLR